MKIEISKIPPLFLSLLGVHLNANPHRWLKELDGLYSSKTMEEVKITSDYPKENLDKDYNGKIIPKKFLFKPKIIDKFIINDR